MSAFVTVNGKYSSWSVWGPCSTTCGLGQKKRSRSCNNPSPGYGGMDCSRYGATEQTLDCFVADCPGRIICHAVQNYSFSSLYVRLNALDYTPKRAFCTFSVTVDGAFSPWTEWSECSKSCGWGYQSRERECNAPEPSHGGKDCTGFGDSSELQACMILDCPGMQSSVKLAN